MTSRAFHAPGRVNLIGEHTDYSGGLVLPAAIDRGITVTVTPDERIVLTSDRVDEDVDLPADGGDPADASGWGRYVAAVAAELDELGRPTVGMRGAVASDLPDGVGLSSSAALEVAVALALLDVADHELAPLEIAKACQRAEHRAVGVPSGILDQSASLLGEEDHALLLDCASLEYRSVPLPADVAIVVVDSGVRRELEGSGYADRRRELEEGMEAAGVPDPKAVTEEELLPRLGGVPDVPGRRLRHVVSENQRVRDLVEVLAEEPLDRGRVGGIFAAGQASMREDFEISVPEIDELVEIALGSGAFAARMTGGGFGGAIIALVDAAGAEEFAATVVERYDAAVDGHTGTALVTRAAAGAGPV